MGNAVGAAIFFVIAPGAIAGLVPFLITRWRLSDAFLGVEVTRWLGAFIALVGLAVIVDAFVRFVREGRGTPVPVAAPRHLVVRGPYQWVRNPMYVAVVAMIVGQALVFASIALLLWAAMIAVAFHLFVVTYEEPTLRGQFGAEYATYTAQVPRWIPRLPRRPERS